MPDNEDAARPKPARREQTRVVGAIVLVGVIVALAFDNRQKVRIGYVVGDAHFRLVYMLLVTAALGAITGFLIGRNRRR